MPLSSLSELNPRHCHRGVAPVRRVGPLDTVPGFLLP
jgi:hypothetical protein